MPTERSKLKGKRHRRSMLEQEGRKGPELPKPKERELNKDSRDNFKYRGRRLATEALEGPMF